MDKQGRRCVDAQDIRRILWLCGKKIERPIDADERPLCQKEIKQLGRKQRADEVATNRIGRHARQCVQRQTWGIREREILAAVLAFEAPAF